MAILISWYNEGSFFVKGNLLIIGGMALKNEAVSIYLSRAVSVYLSAIGHRRIPFFIAELSVS